MVFFHVSTFILQLHLRVWFSFYMGRIQKGGTSGRSHRILVILRIVSMGSFYYNGF